MEEKNYKIVENLLNRAQYIASSNRKAFMNDARYRKLKDKIVQATTGTNR